MKRPGAMTLLSLLLILGALAILQGCATLNAEKNAPPIGRFVDTSAGRLHVIDLAPEGGGEGAPVVLIHGASVNARDMKIALGDRLSKTRRVIAVDRPGRGYSDRGAKGWRLAEQAEAIHEAAAALGLERPIVVGQSFGGAVALAYALAYQDEIAGLVLLAPVSHPWPGGVAWYNNVSGWPVAGFLLRRLVIPVYAPLAAKPGVIKSFAPEEAPANYYENSGLTLLFRPRDFKSNAADLRHLKAQIVEMSGRYGELRVPTTIITGANDSTVSPKIHSMALARDIPGARFELLPDTGHALHHAETDRVIAAIEEAAATP